LKNKQDWTILIIFTLLIFIAGFITFAVPSSEVDVVSWAFNLLLIYYPILFLLQGVVTSLFRTNIFLSLIGSIGAFVLVLFIWMNSSASGYIIIYALIALLSFAVTDFIKKRMNK
jgi:hypothetical protein